MIRLVLVDDHPVVREGLGVILASESDIEVVAMYADAETALEDMPSLAPDIVVLDVRLPGMSGVDACAVLRARNRNVRVILLTSFPSEGAMLSALANGARAFVVKESDPGTLRQAVRAVANGGTFIDPRLADRLVAIAIKRGAKGPLGLTLQEMRVLAQLPQGMSNREIGRHLGLSEDTIKTHLRNAMRKLQAKDRTEAAAIAVRDGLV